MTRRVNKRQFICVVAFNGNGNFIRADFLGDAAKFFIGNMSFSDIVEE